jgi:S1 RNA binding domain protein
MALSVGDVVSGKVTGIVKFGAFIILESGETGLCHISEVSHDFIQSVEDVLKIGDAVTVKVVEISRGKLSLSIKALKAKTVIRQEKSPDFEALMNQFSKTSDERLKDVKVAQKSRRGNSHGHKHT